MPKQREKAGVLDSASILAIADFLAERHGLPKIKPRSFLKQYKLQYPDPIMTSNTNGILWADREYVAYELLGQPTQYAYVTADHVQEETSSYNISSNQRERPIRLEKELCKAFSIASHEMVMTKATYWLSDEARAAIYRHSQCNMPKSLPALM